MIVIIVNTIIIVTIPIPTIIASGKEVMFFVVLIRLLVNRGTQKVKGIFTSGAFAQLRCH